MKLKKIYFFYVKNKSDCFSHFIEIVKIDGQQSIYLFPSLSSRHLKVFRSLPCVSLIHIPVCKSYDVFNNVDSYRHVLLSDEEFLCYL